MDKPRGKQRLAQQFWATCYIFTKHAIHTSHAVLLILFSILLSSMPAATNTRT